MEEVAENGTIRSGIHRTETALRRVSLAAARQHKINVNRGGHDRPPSADGSLTATRYNERVGSRTGRSLAVLFGE